MLVKASFLEIVIYIEILLMILVVLLIFGLKIYLNRKKKRDQRILYELELYLSGLLHTKSPFEPKNFLNRWHRLDLLIPIFRKFSRENIPEWTTEKHHFAKLMMLPLAKKQAVSRIKSHRVYAAMAFEYFMEEEDEPFVCELIRDTTPLIHLHSSIAAVQFGSERCLYEVVSSMTKSRRLGQSLYLNIFKTADPRVGSIIENFLKTEENSYTAALCYKILMLFPVTNSTIDSSKAIVSENIELQLAAIRYEVYTKKQATIPFLIGCLADERWETRALACNLLGSLDAKDAANHLGAALHDPVWWVRINAARALKELGDQGIAILEAQTPEKDLYAYETAQYILSSN